MSHVGNEYEGLRGKYKVVKHISTGGMGKVYDAIGPNGKNVVMKFPGTIDPTTNLPFDKTTYALVIDKLQLESTFLKKFVSLKSPYIVKYLDESKTPNAFFFVMEKIEGESLQDKMSRNRNGLDYKDVIKHSLNILQGLELVHIAHLVYRDLKPANIMIRKNNECVIIDFGGAKKMTEKTGINPMLTSNTGIMSKKWGCHHQVSLTSSYECDLYSFGKILFYLASGVEATVVGIPKKLHEFKPGINMDLSRLVDEIVDRDHKTIHSATQLTKKIKSLSSSTSNTKKRVGSTKKQTVTTKPLQNKNPYIFFDGQNYDIPIDKMGLVLGTYHDEKMCKANNEGCTVTLGANLFVGWECPVNCRCLNNPMHMIDKHHLRIMKNSNGAFCAINNDKYRRSAIKRGGSWSPVTYGHPKILNDGDEVALLYNKTIGPYGTLIFHGR